jgi:vacuolar-type H+-ATPase catalytic subunit A/Vma1
MDKEHLSEFFTNLSPEWNYAREKLLKILAYDEEVAPVLREKGRDGLDSLGLLVLQVCPLLTPFLPLFSLLPSPFSILPSPFSLLLFSSFSPLQVSRVLREDCLQQNVFTSYDSFSTLYKDKCFIILLLTFLDKCLDRLRANPEEPVATKFRNVLEDLYRVKFVCSRREGR